MRDKMKSVLISIKPEWVKKILNGEKTIEIRKTMPKCELPCKVYIYCSKGKYGLTRCMMTEKDKSKGKWTYQRRIIGYLYGEPLTTFGQIDSKVVAEFTLNNVDEFKILECGYNFFDIELCQKSCLTYPQIEKYIGKNKKGYAWHINDLKIYDTPKELKEFSSWLPDNICNEHEQGLACNNCKYYITEYEVCGCCYYAQKQLKRPPQSWCYVEELK